MVGSSVEFGGLTAAQSAGAKVLSPALWHSSVLSRSRWCLSHFNRQGSIVDAIDSNEILP